MFIHLLWQIINIVVVRSEFPPQFKESSTVGIPSGHLKPFGYHRPPDGPLEEQHGFLHPSLFWEKYVSIHKPMVLRQGVVESPAIKKWSDEYLAREYGDLDVLLEVKRENRSTSPRRVNISTFIDIYTKDDVYAVTVLPDPMTKEVQVPTCLLCGTFRNFVHETNFWMSSGGTRSVIHYDADENIHCIVAGSKDFIMIDEPYKKFLPMVEKDAFSGSEYSSLDPDMVDLLEYRDVAKVQWSYATLYPGDCIYIPSTYLHQVRSHKRTISTTILFTSDVEKSYQNVGCEDNKFQYTPLSDIDVHWMYSKGDVHIDMGYINLELLRKNVLEMFDEVKIDIMTLNHFTMFCQYAKDDEDPTNIKEIEVLYSKVFGIDGNDKVTRQDVETLPRDRLKILARYIDDPHGPLKENKNLVSDMYEKEL